jgi:hypothetical protein
MNMIFLTKQGHKLEEETMNLAEETLNEALDGISSQHVNLCKEILQQVYDNLQ